MGIYDREYYRDDTPGIQLGGRWSMVTTLIVINAAVFLLDALLPFFGVDDLMGLMALHADLPRKPWQFYTLITYGFAHARIGDNIFHILFNMFVLFMFGRYIEARLGRNEFLRVYLISLPVCGLVWIASMLIQHPSILSGVQPLARGMVGASGAVTTMVILFCLYQPKATIYLGGFVPVPAWIMGIIIVSMDVFGFTGNAGHTAHEAHLAGAAFGAAYFYFGWNFGKVIPDRWMDWSKITSRRPKLRIHNSNPDETSTGEQSEVSYQDRDTEADAVLEKLHTVGEQSLTPRERKVLEEYSRRMRQKHR